MSFKNSGKKKSDSRFYTMQCVPGMETNLKILNIEFPELWNFEPLTSNRNRTLTTGLRSKTEHLNLRTWLHIHMDMQKLCDFLRFVIKNRTANFLNFRCHFVVVSTWTIVQKCIEMLFSNGLNHSKASLYTALYNMKINCNLWKSHDTYDHIVCLTWLAWKGA